MAVRFDAKVAFTVLKITILPLTNHLYSLTTAGTTKSEYSNFKIPTQINHSVKASTFLFCFSLNNVFRF